MGSPRPLSRTRAGRPLPAGHPPATSAAAAPSPGRASSSSLWSGNRLCGGEHTGGRGGEGRPARPARPSAGTPAPLRPRRRRLPTGLSRFRRSASRFRRSSAAGSGEPARPGAAARSAMGGAGKGRWSPPRRQPRTPPQRRSARELRGRSARSLMALPAATQAQRSAHPPDLPGPALGEGRPRVAAARSPVEALAERPPPGELGAAGGSAPLAAPGV